VLRFEAVGNTPVWPDANLPGVKSQRAFGGTSTLWLYFAAGGAMAVGLRVLSMMTSCGCETWCP
jgi:hypothetical protein